MPRQGKKKPTGKVTVPTLVDRALKADWDSARAIIAAAGHKEAVDFDRKWEAVAAVIFNEPPLYLAGGFATEKDFFDKFMEIDPAQGKRYARVARFASAAEIELYKPAKLDALVGYLEAKAGGPIHGKLPVSLDRVRVPVKDGTASLDEASREDLRAATRALSKKKRRQTTLSAQGAAIVAALEKANLKGIEVSLSKGTVTLRAIPLSDFTRAAAILAKLKLPPLKPPS